MIQVQFLLPPIESSAMTHYLPALVPTLPDERCENVFICGLAPNPRRVKRTLNAFLLLWRLTQKIHS